MSLTSSADSITSEGEYMSESKAELGYSYIVLGLSNAATRMFESALQYDERNVNACYGLAQALFSLSQSGRSVKSNLKSAQKLLRVALKEEPSYLPAQLLQLRIKALVKGLTDSQVEFNFSEILEKGKDLISAQVYRDLAMIQMGRMEYSGKFGALNLLNLSLKEGPTSQSYFLLGKAHYGNWYKEKAAECVTGNSKVEILGIVKSCYVEAVARSYNSRSDMIIQLAIIQEELGEIEAASQLFKLALVSEDVSVQECGYRRLALLEKEVEYKETYLREAIRRSHLVTLREEERKGFWDVVLKHAEQVIQERGSTHAFPWITALVEEEHPKADTLVDLYNKEHHNNPMKSVRGETPVHTRGASRKQSKPKMV